MRHELTDNVDPYFHPIVSAWISENSFDVKKRAITAATYNVIVQIGSVISSRKSYSSHSYQQLNPPDILQSSTARTMSPTTTAATRFLSRSVLFLW